jgi:hypothetical protein
VNLFAEDVRKARMGRSGRGILISTFVHADCGHELPLDLKMQHRLDPLLERILTRAATGSEDAAPA